MAPLSRLTAHSVNGPVCEGGQAAGPGAVILDRVRLPVRRRAGQAAGLDSGGGRRPRPGLRSARR